MVLLANHRAVEESHQEEALEADQLVAGTPLGLRSQLVMAVVLLADQTVAEGEDLTAAVARGVEEGLAGMGLAMVRSLLVDPVAYHLACRSVDRRSALVGAPPVWGVQKVAVGAVALGFVRCA